MIVRLECTNCTLPTAGSLCATCLIRKECPTCHRHLDPHSFTLSNDVCNACYRKETTTRRTALEGRVQEVEIPVNNGYQDIRSFLTENRGFIDQVLDDIAATVGSSIKAYINVRTRLVRETEAGEQATDGTFRSNIQLNSGFDVDEAADHIIAELENFNKEGSSWVLDNITGATISTAVYRPLAFPCARQPKSSSLTPVGTYYYYAATLRMRITKFVLIFILQIRCATT